MKFLFFPIACAMLAACSFEVGETVYTDNSAAIRAAADAQAKQAVHPDNPSPYGLTMGRATVADALKIHPQLAKASSSTVGLGENGTPVPMNNAYMMTDADGSVIVFQFDDTYGTLQNIMLIPAKKPFPQVKKELDALYPPLKRLSREEFEVIGPRGMDFDNQAEWLDKYKSNIAFYKQGDTLIVAAVSTPTPKESVVMYRNSSYIPVLKEKAAGITTRMLPERQ
ncbi:MAG: hypothetical protein Q3966_04345 [Neisseria sp.]|nr:hypothetical protein [Neisseria sp.]